MMARIVGLLGACLFVLQAKDARSQPTTSDVGVSPAPGTAAPSNTARGDTVVLPSIAGDTASSSAPRSEFGAYSDGFNLNAGGQSAPVLRGSKGSYAITGAEPRALTVPDIHTVRRGDTLWGLCAHYYDDPWSWPRVWSYNPEIRNPNWIYPGDQLRLRAEGESGRSPVVRGRTLSRQGPGGLVEQRSMALPDTVFLRNSGYIDDPQKDVIGEVVGAREEQMLLSEGNRIYLDIKDGGEVRIGQQVTLFERVRKPPKVEGARQPPGEIVAIKGTVRVDDYDPNKRIATGEITESVDIIERGTKVGVVGRSFLVVAPKPSAVTLWARVLTGLYPNVYFAQHQVLFIDRGSEDGLAPGNRLVVVRRGDTWRRSLSTTTRSARDRVRMDVEENVEVEPTELKREEGDFPEEIVAELRVLQAHRYSSVAVVVSSAREVVPGDRAVARQGF